MELFVGDNHTDIHWDDWVGHFESKWDVDAHEERLGGIGFEGKWPVHYLEMGMDAPVEFAAAVGVVDVVTVVALENVAAVYTWHVEEGLAGSSGLWDHVDGTLWRIVEDSIDVVDDEQWLVVPFAPNNPENGDALTANCLEGHGPGSHWVPCLALIDDTRTRLTFDPVETPWRP